MDTKKHCRKHRIKVVYIHSKQTSSYAHTYVNICASPVLKDFLRVFFVHLHKVKPHQGGMEYRFMTYFTKMYTSEHFTNRFPY